LRLGVQLYTLREFTGTRAGFETSLGRIRDLGYSGVQVSAVGCMNGPNPELSPSEAHDLLAAYGLVAPVTHRAWDDLLFRTDEEIAFHKCLGSNHVFLSSAPPEVHEAGAEGFRSFLAPLRQVFDAMAAESIVFGYHNHALEFTRETDGLRPIDVLVGADWLPFELDTYWAHVAGASLPKLIQSLTGRLPIVHLKDVGVYGGVPGIAPVGEGNLDWDEILPLLAAAGTEWLMVELDTTPRDVFECLASSVEFLRRRLP